MSGGLGRPGPFLQSYYENGGKDDPPGWFLESKSNPDWNTKGTCKCINGGVPPKEVVKKVFELEKKFGNPPRDLMWGTEFRAFKWEVKP